MIKNLPSYNPHNKKGNVMPTKEKKNWKKVADNRIQHIWKSGCDCKTKRAGDVSVTPDWYQENGTPICGECGSDMRYSHAEILV